MSRIPHAPAHTRVRVGVHTCAGDTVAREARLAGANTVRTCGHYVAGGIAWARLSIARDGVRTVANAPDGAVTRS